MQILGFRIPSRPYDSIYLHILSSAWRRASPNESTKSQPGLSGKPASKPTGASAQRQWSSNPSQSIT
ncbi:hypothetical protein EMPG_12053 [Blastomyces silverae]|uniref:Uncharacterized protein n=1 Tax=Blastomyces silverae TaxID=2060906 RepID=A0A0H1BPF5_9EURO|nr:hypothetical protein EMPG_12053 [Blastomyces silverae]